MEDILTDDCKVEGIKKIAYPQLQSFLGFTNYYHCFIKGGICESHPFALWSYFQGQCNPKEKKRKLGVQKIARKSLMHWRLCAPLPQF